MLSKFVVVSIHFVDKELILILMLTFNLVSVKSWLKSDGVESVLYHLTRKTKIDTMDPLFAQWLRNQGFAEHVSTFSEAGYLSPEDISTLG